MRFHDIVSNEDGWSHHVDGVFSARYPSWFLAVNAARRSAEDDGDDGIDCAVRFQAMDGNMLPLQQRETAEARARFAPVMPVGRATEGPRIAG